MKILKKIFISLSKRCRAKRSDLFLRHMNPSHKDRILDLGSDDGSSFANMLPFRENVFIADIDRNKLLLGKERFGFKTVLLNEDCSLPFEDNFFDIIHCNSVIEHVGINNAQKWSIQNGKEFKKVAFERQCKFAKEINRVAKNYFVQTPNKYFFFESHTWLPFVQFIPRSILIKIIRWLNRWWIKKTSPDWNLLTKKQMKTLFPEAIIIREKVWGLTKSLMAVKSEQQFTQ